MNARTISLGTALAVVPLLAAAGPVAGKSGDFVQRSGTCSAGSTWKLKAKPDDGRIETEFEVDQNRNGVRWNVTLKRAGKTAVKTTRTTKAPSGSFSLNRRLTNGPGKEKISVVATRSGETCRGSVTL